ncbi:hypothetical protein [Bartonella doshiae]|uniref:hypothetical protein n=1 Tax=Bartonella doshiae TaxID=33044 RepID=UPI001ABAB341|nr:hypothetical protein [Bartonella doshiae]
MIGQKRYGRGKSFISTSVTMLKSIHVSYKKLHNNQIIHNDPTQHNYHGLPIYAFLSYQWAFEYNAMEEKISEISVLYKKAKGRYCTQKVQHAYASPYLITYKEITYVRA